MRVILYFYKEHWYESDFSAKVTSAQIQRSFRRYSVNRISIEQEGERREIIIDGICELRRPEHQRKLMLRSLLVRQEIEVEVPYVEEHGAIRPPGLHEQPRGFLKIKILMDPDEFTVYVQNPDGNLLNMVEPGSGCSLHIGIGLYGTTVKASVGSSALDTRQVHYLSDTAPKNKK